MNAKLKNIRIAAKRLVHSTLAGDYKAAFQGQGLEFNQLREYQPGDDVRLISWSSLAKSGKLMIKEFVAERDRLVLLLVDVSASTAYASGKDLKREVLAEFAATIAEVAALSGDRVGLLLFSDRVEAWLPPASSRGHTQRMLEALLETQPQGTHTSIDAALRFLLGLSLRNATVFMVSDFVCEPESYRRLLRVAQVKHDLIAVRMLDDAERILPDVGLLELVDSESGEQVLVDTSDSRVQQLLKNRLRMQEQAFAAHKVDLLDLSVNKPYLMPLIKFFHQRIARSSCHG